MINKIISFRNKLDFKIRQMVRWKRGGLQLSRVSKTNVFTPLAAPEKQRAKGIEARLLRTYDFQDVIDRGDKDNYCINLYYLELLETTFNLFDRKLPQTVDVADIGCSSWFYVRALHSFLSGWRMDAGKRIINLTGYELDAYRPYFNLFSRYDYAHVFSKNLTHTRYVPEGFQLQKESFDIVCQFFPFVFTKDHLEWGLPAEYFFPGDLLQDAWSSLRKDGILLVVNQGIEEHERQKELFAGLKITPGVSFRVDSHLFHYGIDHFVLGATKDE